MTYLSRSVTENKRVLPSITHHNIVDIPMLHRMCDVALILPDGQIYKAIILMGFLAFLHLSNLCPHSLTSFDPSRHLTGADLVFTKQYVQVKWSNAMQTRDAIHILTLPQFLDKKLCPRSALKALHLLYPFDSHSPLFQWQGHGGGAL